MQKSGSFALAFLMCLVFACAPAAANEGGFVTASWLVDLDLAWSLLVPAKSKCITIGGKRVCFEDDAKNRDDDDDDEDDKPKKKKTGNICGGETACPPGYVVLEKPNRYGACCEPKEGLPPPKQVVCAAGEVGTPPNCIVQMARRDRRRVGRASSSIQKLTAAQI